MRRPKSLFSPSGIIFSFQLISAQLNILLPSYSATVLLSFAHRAAIPAVICGPLRELISKWTVTALPLMNIIGQTFNALYIERTWPVFSSRKFDNFHFTLVGLDRGLLHGRQAICPNSCNQSLSSGSRSATVDGNPGRRYQFICPECGFVSITKVANHEKIPKGYKHLIFNIPGVDYLRTQLPIPIMPLSQQKKVEGPSPMVAEEDLLVQATSVSAPSSVPPSPPLITTPLLESEVEETQEPPNLTPQHSEIQTNSTRMQLALEAVTFSVLGQWERGAVTYQPSGLGRILGSPGQTLLQKEAQAWPAERSLRLVSALLLPQQISG